MSIDYLTRVHELTDYARETYGIAGQDMRIILACLLPADRPVWLVIESEDHQLWRHIDLYMRRRHRAIAYLPTIRAIRPRYVNPSVQPYLEHRGEPALFLDTSLPTRKPSDRNLYHKLNSECLRLRVRINLRPDRIDAAPLLDKIEQVIEYDKRRAIPVAMRPPALLTYYLDLLRKLNPELGPGAIESACLVPPAHACLHGRSKLEDADHLALHRLIRDSIRLQTYKLLEKFAEEDGAHKLKELTDKLKMSTKVIIKQINMLDAHGILYWPNTQGRSYRYIEPGAAIEDIKGLINGLGRWWEHTENGHA